MTAPDYDALTDAELDRLAAEMMGAIDDGVAWRFPDGRRCRYVEHILGDDPNWRPDWSPTTDPRDERRVVEWVRGRGYFWRIYVLSTDGYPYSALCSNLGSGLPMSQGISDSTIGRAVVIAALRARDAKERR